MPSTRREFLEGLGALGAGFLFSNCASAPARGPVSLAAPTPAKKDVVPLRAQAASQFRLMEDTALPNPNTAIEQITVADQIIAKYYPELGDMQPRDAVRIQTPNNSLFIFNFTDYGFDPVATLQTYSFYERFARSGYSGLYRTLNKQEIPFKILPPEKANILVFIVPQGAPDPEWILQHGGANRPAGTIIDYKQGVKLTRVRESVPQAEKASVDAEVASSREKYTDLLLLIEAGQTIINIQAQVDEEVSTRIADSFCNSLARALFSRGLGRSYTEYAKYKAQNLATGFIVGNNLIFPAIVFDEEIYNQLPVITPIIKPANSLDVYSAQK